MRKPVWRLAWRRDRASRAGLGTRRAVAGGGGGGRGVLGFVWNLQLAQPQDAGQGALNDVVEAGFVAVEEQEVGMVVGQGVEGIDGALQLVGRVLGGDFEVEGPALHAPEPAEAPGGGAHLLDGLVLDRIARADAPDVALEHVLEAVVGFVGENDGPREQAVAERVPRGAIFAFGRGGAAGAGAVGAGRGLLSGCGLPHVSPVHSVNPRAAESGVSR